MADINILYAQRDSITRQLATVRFELQSTPTTATAERQALVAQEARLAAELVQINQQISIAQQSASAPRQSAGQIVREAQAARDEGAP
jgi:predicted  nucleic acid-binding Zn-ribbon protein